MSVAMQPDARYFLDRRTGDAMIPPGGRERRQFADGHAELSPAAQELANAVDNYKLMHRRRFVTYEEILHVMKSLGYARPL
ncbi:MAG TPA: hypothetical protein VHZ24_09730 [Pirellulales bacterium]|jgi:hypothetical protein|nr:hypothetical protein [Pirellulales bacterium]